MTPHEKGIDLEDAVHAIETVILESSPALRKQPFIIESRKRLCASGVHHEIDIFVTVEIAQGYQAIYVFECKNWQESVGKNEIIVFSEKIKAASAQRGYFIARSFTKDAAAQAVADPRITLLIAAEHSPATTIVPSDFHVTSQVSSQYRVECSLANAPEWRKGPSAIFDQMFNVNGQGVSAQTYFADWLGELYQKGMRTLGSARLAVGVHPLAVREVRAFDPKECTVGGIPLLQLTMEAEFGVEIFRPLVMSHYEVAHRGRVIKLAKLTVRDIEIDFSAIEIGNGKLSQPMRADIYPGAPSQKLHPVQEEILRHKNVEIVLSAVEDQASS